MNGGLVDIQHQTQVMADFDAELDRTLRAFPDLFVEMKEQRENVRQAVQEDVTRKKPERSLSDMELED